MERSAALRAGADTRRLSHQRLVRLSDLMHRNGLPEDSMRQWVDHASRITLKRLDDELRHVETRPTSQYTSASQKRFPLPLSDTAWQESLQLIPGEARRRLLSGALEALACQAPANVCLRLQGPAEIIRDLRHSLNLTRMHLSEQGRRLVEQSCRRPDVPLSAADEARLFPSIRLARTHVERGTPIPDWICLLALLEEFVEEWDNPNHMPRRPTDSIASRDGWRCTAPGCTAREIEVHHVIYQSHGGADTPANLTSLCPFHHRMGEHGSLARVAGSAPLDLHWQLGHSEGRRIQLKNERYLDPEDRFGQPSP
jgi:hypothetical protein